MRTLLRRHNLSVIYLALTDYAIVVGSFAVIMRLRFMPEIDIIDLSHLRVIPQVSFVFLYALFFLAIFSALGLYKRKVLLDPLWQGMQIVKGITIGIAVYMLLQYASKSTLLLEYRSVTFSWAIALALCACVNRLMLFEFLRKAVYRSDWRRRVVVIGASEVGREFALKCLSGEDYPSLKVIGFLDDSLQEGAEIVKGLKRLGDTSSLQSIIDLYNIEGAVVTTSAATYKQLMDITEECVRLFGWVDIHCDQTLGLKEHLDTDTYFEIPFFRMGDVPNTPLISAYKRVSDLAMACLGVVLLCPVFVAVAIWIKLVSPGPVLYASERIGHRGRPFKFFKFRSMKMGADRDEARQRKAEDYVRNDKSGLPSKIINETHLIPGGRFMRRWALDELPQLFNVIKGDMSVVGARPLPRNEYEASDDWQKRRFDVKPGCTGLWKLYAARHPETTFGHSAFYDIYYSRNMNPLLDLYIVLGTVHVILLGRADA